MRNWFVFLVLLCLPIHWVWAESAACRPDVHAPSHYQHARAAAQLPPGSFNEAEAVDVVQNSVWQSFSGEPSWPAAEMPGWEFELEEEFDIVEQISEPSWGDVAVDSLSCRLPDQDGGRAGPPPDPHEFDLPLSLMVVAPSLADALFIALQHPPLPAPVFGAYRPPSLTA
ncbi:MAG: hypothetical protein QHC78_12940 [Pigmentiphaga sp.]|uniref:hypothetical protein n=1 Tax=Pigmentiphaga sp. TaxID=1977564 RepID=UPI0029BF2304|nr:hypothetical protein [Pigmentiphaga sp.]MDX3906586.1 hypothetical protein [Pigmentiphaga sp.]